MATILFYKLEYELSKLNHSNHFYIIWDLLVAILNQLNFMKIYIIDSTNLILK